MYLTRTTANPGTIPTALIGSFFAARVAITFVCVRWLGLDPQVGAAMQILLGLLLFAMLCFHTFCGSTLSPRAVLYSPSIRWVMMFLLFSLLSFAWSGAVSPAASFAYWCELSIDVGTMLLLQRIPSFGLHAEALLRGYIYAACALASLAWILPAQDDLRLGDI